jgi:hypothetical protein
MTRLYIAYGSNLNKRAMRIRCPAAKSVGKFMLTNARLVFRGVADVEYSPTDKVPCGLWEINRADERTLDTYEGVGSGFYYKEEGIALKFRGERRNALIYLMCSEGVYPPSQGYVDVIRQGYRDFGMDEQYLDQAIARSFLKKEPDEQTMARRERQRQDPRVRFRRLVELPESVALKRLERRRSVETGG